jgi:hypothetical protein
VPAWAASSKLQRRERRALRRLVRSGYAGERYAAWREAYIAAYGRDPTDQRPVFLADPLLTRAPVGFSLSTRELT